MATRVPNVRFMENNYAELISASITKSSELASFPFSNAINKFRSLVWKPSGHFEITTSNQELYINDGADKTVSITVGDYDTPDDLATQIQTDLNAASSNWTVVYDAGSGDYSFKISNSGSVSLRLSQTSNAIWDDIGYTTSTDLTGTSFTADQQRNHTDEYCIFDLGTNQSMTFFAAISPLDELFSISSNATIKLEASNLNQWTAPPLTVTLSRLDGGIFQFMDDLDDTSYRYWRFHIVDKKNPNGPEGLSLGHIYLGDYITLTSRGIGRRFTKKVVDSSDTLTSQNGSLYFNEKTKYTTLSGMNISYLPREDKDTLEQMFFDLGRTTPFYVSLDPLTNISDNLDEFTKYVVFSSEPTFNHVFSDKFTMNIELRELI